MPLLRRTLKSRLILNRNKISAFPLPSIFDDIVLRIIAIIGEVYSNNNTKVVQSFEIRNIFVPILSPKYKFSSNLINQIK